jgi:DMSO/TMAO reductase YedYZ molybdopterin-dependent catalytic subunit
MVALSLMFYNSNTMQLKNTILIILYCAMFFTCNTKPKTEKNVASVNMNDIFIKVGEKDSLRLLTDRPPNLETPLKYFLQDYTPNSVFFVRWHLAGLPSKIDLDTFRLRVTGNVEHPLELSMHDLKTKFTPYTITALAQCAGNSRSFFDPRVPGGQWKNGAMGNAKWTGVKVKDVLAMAGVRSGSKEVTFNGLDVPPMAATPDFVKSLQYDHAVDGDVMIAYEMNGEPLPLLNGYPLKLVVPGWYATYWVGMLNEMQVLTDTFRGFWMQKAYLIPKESGNGNESPDSLATNMQPINKMDVRSIFVSPEPEDVIPVGKASDIEGLAFDGGDGITKVELSADSGKTWQPARLGADLGKYSWRRWHFGFTPVAKGVYSFQVKAVNAKGETQPERQWNRSGYMRNEIETLTIKAE